jgi:SM-20-related protein
VKDKKLGELRLYLDDSIIDIVPRIGRTIIFKSELVEHEVRPTQGYERFAITTWFSNQIKEQHSD